MLQKNLLFTFCVSSSVSSSQAKRIKKVFQERRKWISWNFHYWMGANFQNRRSAWVKVGPFALFCTRSWDIDVTITQMRIEMFWRFLCNTRNQVCSAPPIIGPDAYPRVYPKKGTVPLLLADTSPSDEV